MMAPFETDQIKNLAWLNSKKTKLKPTRKTQAFVEFRYIVKKAGQLNKLFNLQDWDAEIPGTAYKRGSGGQQLYLSQAAGQRGQTTTLVSSVTGQVTVQLRVYPDSLPQFLMTYDVSTADANNHITWARDYDAQTRAGFRNMIKAGLDVMMADALYPTGGMATWLTAPATDAVFTSPHPPPANQALLTMED